MKLRNEHVIKAVLIGHMLLSVRQWPTCHQDLRETSPLSLRSPSCATPKVLGWSHADGSGSLQDRAILWGDWSISLPHACPYQPILNYIILLPATACLDSLWFCRRTCKGTWNIYNIYSGRLEQHMHFWKESRKKALSLYETLLGVNGLAGLSLSRQGLIWYPDWQARCKCSHSIFKGTSKCRKGHHVRGLRYIGHNA